MTSREVPTNISKTVDHPDLIKEKQKIQDFLVNYQEHGEFRYQDQLQEIADRARTILEIFLDDLKSYKNDDSFYYSIQSNSFRYISLFEEVADTLLPGSNIHQTDNDVYDILQRQLIVNSANNNSMVDDTNIIDDVVGNTNNQQNVIDLVPKRLFRRFSVSFIPLRGDRPRKLRDIKAADVGHFVSTTGMVTRTSDVKPYMSVVTYICQVCNSESFQEITGHQFKPFDYCTSTSCKENRSNSKLTMQLRGSKFNKYQEIRIQELPDQVPVGNIPRTISVHCFDEQTRKCSPGDIITIGGILMIVRYSGFKAMTAGLQADSYVQAYYIEKQKLSYEDVSLQNKSEYSSILQQIAGYPDPYEYLANSIAPEIYGHLDIKKALLLQLVGGVNRVLNDGVKIRGDINICLMGDPGLAKSQLLKYIAIVAPRGVYTTGKGSSGVGLTAAVVRDNTTGDMALEGGALVLADKGICCIDEFDKMDDSDRTAIHEVMEQQTVSIAKAGISTTLNARAAVLAAANPLYGRYNLNKSISENVNLPNSLLSRFDLLFLILDKIDMAADTALSKHVLHVHRYRCNPGSIIDSNSNSSNPNSNGNSSRTSSNLPISAIKAYIGEARKLNPVIPKELTQYIVEVYVGLRQNQNADQRPHRGRRMMNSNSNNDQTAMTPRQLLSILRLSQALARLRMSPTVRHEDVDEALRLVDSSKSSLNSNESSAAQLEDASSSIFNMIRDSLNNSIMVRMNNGINKRVIAYGALESMIVQNGFTTNQFLNCLREYSELGILAIDSERTQIELICE